MRSHSPHLVVLLVLAGVTAVVTAGGLSDYGAYLANLAGIGVILALSLNALMGFSGQISLGHAAFLGVGAYCSALLTLRLDLPVLLAIPVAGAAAAVVGFIVGLPALRIGSHYLAMVTIAFGVIMHSLAMNLRGITGGYAGLGGIPAPQLLGFAFSSQRTYFILVALTLAVVYLAMARIEESWVGRAMFAMREDETAAESLGISIVHLKLGAFVLSAFGAGIAGGLYAHWIRFVSPEALSLNASLAPFVAVLVGGAGNVFGVAAAAAVLSLLPEFLRFTPYYYMLLYGIALVFFGIFLPNGIAGAVKRAGMRPKPGVSPAGEGPGHGSRA